MDVAGTHCRPARHVPDPLLPAKTGLRLRTKRALFFDDRPGNSRAVSRRLRRYLLVSRRLRPGRQCRGSRRVPLHRNDRQDLPRKNRARESRPAWYRHRPSFRAGGLHDWHSQRARLRVCDRSGRRAPYLRAGPSVPSTSSTIDPTSRRFPTLLRASPGLTPSSRCHSNFWPAGRRHGRLRSRSPPERRSLVPCPRTPL